MIRWQTSYNSIFWDGNIRVWLLPKTSLLQNLWDSQSDVVTPSSNKVNHIKTERDSALLRCKTLSSEKKRHHLTQPGREIKVMYFSHSNRRTMKYSLWCHRWWEHIFSVMSVHTQQKSLYILTSKEQKGTSLYSICLNQSKKSV